MYKLFSLLILFVLIPVSSAELSYYHYDLQGNVRHITNSNGNVIEESKYLPFGERFDSDMKDVHGFTGKELDKSDNYYFNARYQSPSEGRFLTPDTVKPDLENPQSLNLYTYTLNNPIKYIDPSGNEEMKVKKHVSKFVKSKWKKMMNADIPEINKVSNQINLPAEAILAAIFVEDFRIYERGTSSISSWSSFKTSVRKILPNKVLNALGHKSNPSEGYSAYGMVWDDTLLGAVTYLNSVENLDLGTKNILAKSSIFEGVYVAGLSDVESVAIALKAHSEYWKRSGYDIFDHNFDTISTLGERVGVLETLNAIFSYDLELKEFNARIPFGGIRKEIPKNNPGLGATELMDGMTNYGEISRILVDSGIANEMLDLD